MIDKDGMIQNMLPFMAPFFPIDPIDLDIDRLLDTTFFGKMLKSQIARIKPLEGEPSQIILSSMLALNFAPLIAATAWATANEVAVRGILGALETTPLVKANDQPTDADVR